MGWNIPCLWSSTAKFGDNLLCSNGSLIQRALKKVHINSMWLSGINLGKSGKLLWKNKRLQSEHLKWKYLEFKNKIPLFLKAELWEGRRESSPTRGWGLPHPLLDIFYLDNLRSPERNPWLTANKKTETSLLWLQGTEFYKQPGPVWKKTPDQAGANTLISTL